MKCCRSREFPGGKDTAMPLGYMYISCTIPKTVTLWRWKLHFSCDNVSLWRNVEESPTSLWSMLHKLMMIQIINIIPAERSVSHVYGIFYIFYIFHR